jgi:hypothetical protein
MNICFMKPLPLAGAMLYPSAAVIEALEGAGVHA